MPIKIQILPAGEGDCALILSEKHNILIDFGSEKGRYTYENLKKQVNKSIQDNNIDLAIITHSDDDHIGGFLTLLSENAITSKIQNYWFNSISGVSKFLDKTDLGFPQLFVPISPNDKGATLSGFRQDNELQQVLKNTGKWNASEIITNNKIFEPGSNFKLTVLSPNKDKLINLYVHWVEEQKLYDSKMKGKKKSAKKPCVFDYYKKINEFPSYPITFINDYSAVNGSSIAFLLEAETTKGLFLGDSHIDVVYNSLISKPHCYNKQNKLKLDFVKLSHHGSYNNLNDDLLDIIDCDNFIISANGNRKNCHPNKETLVRILKHPNFNNKAINFYLNNISDNTIEKERRLQNIFLVDIDIQPINHTDFIQYKYENWNLFFPSQKEAGIILYF